MVKLDAFRPGPRASEPFKELPMKRYAPLVLAAAIVASAVPAFGQQTPAPTAGRFQKASAMVFSRTIARFAIKAP